MLRISETDVINEEVLKKWKLEKIKKNKHLKFLGDNEERAFREFNTYNKSREKQCVMMNELSE